MENNTTPAEYVRGRNRYGYLDAVDIEGNPMDPHRAIEELNRLREAIEHPSAAALRVWDGKRPHWRAGTSHARSLQCQRFLKELDWFIDVSKAVGVKSDDLLRQRAEELKKPLREEMRRHKRQAKALCRRLSDGFDLSVPELDPGEIEVLEFAPDYRDRADVRVSAYHRGEEVARVWVAAYATVHPLVWPQRADSPSQPRQMWMPPDAEHVEAATRKVRSVAELAVKASREYSHLDIPLLRDERSHLQSMRRDVRDELQDRLPFMYEMSDGQVRFDEPALTDLLDRIDERIAQLDAAIRRSQEYWAPRAAQWRRRMVEAGAHEDLELTEGVEEPVILKQVVDPAKTRGAVQWYQVRRAIAEGHCEVNGTQLPEGVRRLEFVDGAPVRPWGPRPRGAARLSSRDESA